LRTATKNRATRVALAATACVVTAAVGIGTAGMATATESRTGNDHPATVEDGQRFGLVEGVLRGVGGLLGGVTEGLEPILDGLL